MGRVAHGRPAPGSVTPPASGPDGIAPSLGTAALRPSQTAELVILSLQCRQAPPARPPHPPPRSFTSRVRPCVVAPADPPCSLIPYKMRKACWAGLPASVGTVLRDGGGLRYILRLLSSSHCLPLSLVPLPARAPSPWIGSEPAPPCQREKVPERGGRT